MLTGNREQAIQINQVASEMFMPAEDTTLAAQRRKPNATFFDVKLVL
jgi:hypothetical protein